MTTQHTFGESDKLDAQSFIAGTRVTVKVSKFLGRFPFKEEHGRQVEDAFYEVDDKGIIREYRLGFKAEQTLKIKYHMTRYEDLVGKEITLDVKRYKLGFNGFVLVDVRDGPGKAQEKV
ncbi:MAG: hypothetical protein KGH64_06580 [Candidatus Micrarchaeota archaeon]|nr:hypothetical protein [Candidatus Micrarchaeota archaeon]